MRVRGLLVLSLILVSAAVYAVDPVDDPGYTIKELPGLPGETGASGAYAVNDKGQIAGTVANRAVVWNAEGNIKPLPLPPRMAVANAADINEAGQVVGWVAREQAAPKQAVLWEPDGKVVMLSDLGGQSHEATAVNNKGWVVGCTVRDGEPAQAFFWRPKEGTVSVFGEPDEETRALDIDDSGQTVGWSTDAEGVKHPFLRKPNGEMTDMMGPVWEETLGRLAQQHPCGASSKDFQIIKMASGVAITSINNKGQIAGKHGDLDENGRMFMWSEKEGNWYLGRLENLPKAERKDAGVAAGVPSAVPYTLPSALNDAGEIVGSSSGAILTASTGASKPAYGIWACSPAHH